MNTLINTTIDTTRRISHNLLPPTLEDFGLVETIKELQTNFNRSGVIDIEFKLLDAEIDIADKIVELNLFRVLQELINNSIRHGKSTEIEIKLWLSISQMKLVYSDNGIGFDPAVFASNKGMGRKNMESRLQMIKASYEYQSVPGQGMKMIIIRKVDLSNHQKVVI
jgi:signal transduction histidine kinase